MSPPLIHLKDLLLEHQEPFNLPVYIADHRLRLHKPPSTEEQRKPPFGHVITKNRPRTASFWTNPCFSSSSSSSPLFQSSSIAASTGLFRHVPGKTAALLQKQNPRLNGNPLSGLFGSVLKRLKGWSPSQNRARQDCEVGAKGEGRDGGLLFEDAETVKLETGDLASCSSPMSPFPFALQCDADCLDRRHPMLDNSCNAEQQDKDQNSPVSVLDTKFEDDDGNEVVVVVEEEEEEEEGCEEDGDDHEGSTGHNLECRYAFVQRAKKRLLWKLRRFEKLAELDHVELDKRILEEGDEDGSTQTEEEEEDQYEEEQKEEDADNSLAQDILCKLGFEDLQKRAGMKRVISDLVDEEDHDEHQKLQGRARSTCNLYAADAVVKRVCTRLESWGRVEGCNIYAIDQMARESSDLYSKSPEQITQVASAIEVEIFIVLVDEIMEELI